MDRLAELLQRIDEYQQHSLRAEKIALDKLRNYPQATNPLSPVEVLRREVFRHHTRTLLLKEIKEWIDELRGMRLYQLYSVSEDEPSKMLAYNVRQYMTEREAAEVNTTFEANSERLRWKAVELVYEQSDK